MQVDLNPNERDFLRRLIKDHLDYYRLLASSPRCSSDKRAKLALLEALEGKLAGTQDCD